MANKVVSEKTNFTYTYDKKGNIASRVRQNPNGSTEIIKYKYNGNKRTLTTSIKGKDGNVKKYTTKQTLNADGKVKTSVKKNEKGETVETVKNKYGKDGKITESNIKRISGGKTIVIKKSGYNNNAVGISYKEVAKTTNAKTGEVKTVTYTVTKPSSLSSVIKKETGILNLLKQAVKKEEVDNGDNINGADTVDGLDDEDKEFVDGYGETEGADTPLDKDGEVLDNGIADEEYQENEPDLDNLINDFGTNRDKDMDEEEVKKEF